MGILRSIESRLERVVEGSVGRLFRASVAPVELARKLAKELEEGKVVSVTQTYAPNEYTIYLSPRDRTRFADFEASLRNELASYLAEHARRAGYVMPTRPRVRFETESSLHTGIFGISTALVRDDEAPLEPLAGPPPAAAAAASAAAGCRARPAAWAPPPCPRGARRAASRPGRAAGRRSCPTLRWTHRWNRRWMSLPSPRSRCARRSTPTRRGRPRASPSFPLDPEPVEAVVHPPFVPPLPDVPPLPRAARLPRRVPRRGRAAADPVRSAARRDHDRAARAARGARDRARRAAHA